MTNPPKMRRIIAAAAAIAFLATSTYACKKRDADEGQGALVASEDEPTGADAEGAETASGENEANDERSDDDEAHTSTEDEANGSGEAATIVLPAGSGMERIRPELPRLRTADSPQRLQLEPVRLQVPERLRRAGDLRGDAPRLAVPRLEQPSVLRRSSPRRVEQPTQPSGE